MVDREQNLRIPEGHDHPTNKRQLVIKNLLGNGMCGKVYLGIKRDDDSQVYAIKVISEGRSSKRLQRELNIPLFIQGHPNIVKYYGYFIEDGYYYILNEYIDGVCLDDWVLPDKRQPSNFLLLLNIIYQLLDAYQFIHSCDVVHRDVKPENIMLKDEKTPYIIDFDLAATYYSSNSEKPGYDIKKNRFICYDLVGTPLFYAPEIWAEDSPINYTLADTYSLGIVIYYLMNDKSLPYFAETYDDFYQTISLQPPKPSKSGSLQLDKMIMGLLQRDPNVRMTLSQGKEIVKTIISNY